MSDFTTGKKISFTVFLEHLIYSLMALTWHHIEGKDLLPNLRLHAKEALKQARGAREEGARYFGRKGRIRCRETLTWVSLASQPATQPLASVDMSTLLSFPVVVSRSPEASREPSWARPRGREASFGRHGTGRFSVLSTHCTVQM